MPTIISGDGSADFNTPLPVAEGGTGASTSIGSGGVMLSGQTGSAPVFGARAWCVFNGTTAGTNAPTAGGNVSTVTRNGTGDYTITFSTAMPDTNFAVMGAANIAAANKTVFTESNTARTTTTVNVITSQAGGASAQSDPTLVSVVIFR